MPDRADYDPFDIETVREVWVLVHPESGQIAGSGYHPGSPFLCWPSQEAAESAADDMEEALGVRPETRLLVKSTDDLN